MATTTNYSWSTPDDTALVKDGAAAIRSLGTAIDTTVFNNASAAIAKTIVDAKGDIIVATAADTVARLAVGANGTVLTAASGQATGLEWVTPAGGGKVLQVVSASTSTSATSTSTTYADTNLTCNITPTLASSKVLILISQIVMWNRDNQSGGVGLKIMRGATTVYEPDGNAGTVASTNNELLTAPKASEQKLVQTFNYLDSPATTSSTTYKTQFRVYDASNSGRAICQYSSTTSVITLLEIGA